MVDYSTNVSLMERRKIHIHSSCMNSACIIALVSGDLLLLLCLESSTVLLVWLPDHSGLWLMGRCTVPMMLTLAWWRRRCRVCQCNCSFMLATLLVRRESPRVKRAGVFCAASIVTVSCFVYGWIPDCRCIFQLWTYGQQYSITIFSHRERIQPYLSVNK